MEPALVDLQNVQVIRGDNVALDNFSLRINSGEHVAILGPNGCGKSTLIKTITRECYPVARPDSSMSIFGEESWDVFKLRPRLGIVGADARVLAGNDSLQRHQLLFCFWRPTGRLLLNPIHCGA